MIIIKTKLSLEISKSSKTNPFYHKDTHQNSFKSTGSCSSPISYADVVKKVENSPISFADVVKKVENSPISFADVVKKLMLRNLKMDFLQLQVLHSTI